jgi:hypothetical protein
MEDLVESVTRGNATEVKVVLATVVAALAIYQVALMTVGWGWLRVGFLAREPASRAHRAIGDAIVAVTVVVALLCVGYFGFEDDGGAHAVLGAVLLGVIAVKVLVVRRGGSLTRWLPVLGITALALFILTWATSAGEFLATGPDG